MKDLDMMHYFLGMEVWKNVDGIFLRQGKYSVEILKRFKMMDYKAMTTPIALNMKLLSDASSENGWCYDVSSDDWVLEVPDGYDTRYLLCYEHIETCSLDGCKGYR